MREKFSRSESHVTFRETANGGKHNNIPTANSTRSTCLSTIDKLDEISSQRYKKKSFKFLVWMNVFTSIHIPIGKTTQLSGLTLK